MQPTEIFVDSDEIWEKLHQKLVDFSGQTLVNALTDGRKVDNGKIKFFVDDTAKALASYWRSCGRDEDVENDLRTYGTDLFDIFVYDEDGDEEDGESVKMFVLDGLPILPDLSDYFDACIFYVEDVLGKKGYDWLNNDSDNDCVWITLPPNVVAH